MNPAMIGGVAGGLLGLAGGAFGTYCSIKNTNGPKEQQFVIKAAIIAWVALLIFLALLFLLPNPYRWVMWIPYAVLLPIGIVHWNRRQAQIRKEESEPTN